MKELDISKVGTVSQGKTLLLLLKAYVGAGILFLPMAFSCGSFAFSIVGMLFVSFLATLGMVMLAKAALRVPGSFEDIARHAYGLPAYICVLCSVAVSQLGFSTSYITFVAKAIMILVYRSTTTEPHSKANEKQFMKDNQYYALLMPIICVPLILVRKMDWLGRFSLVGILAIIASLIIIVIECFKEIPSIKDTLPSLFKAGPELEYLPAFLGVALFAFEGIGLVVPILRSMKNPEMFPKVCYISMAITTALYTAFGILGFAAFNSREDESITSRIRADAPQTYAVVAMYTLAITLSWPLAMSPAVTIIQRLLLGDHSGRISTRNKMINNALRVGLTLGVCLVGTLVLLDFDLFLTYLGLIVCIPLSFVIPPLIHYKVFAHRGKKIKIINFTFATFGVLISIVATTLQIDHDIQKRKRLATADDSATIAGK